MVFDPARNFRNQRRMKLSVIIIKTLLGAALAGLAFFLVNRFVPFNLFGIPYLLTTLLSFVVGAFSILVLPLLGAAISAGVRRLVASAFRETFIEFWGAQSRRLRDLREPAKAKSVLGGAILDTSVIIDGRILDIARTGFLMGRLIVPQFVLDELQRVADSKDDLRRKKGRRGLEVLKSLRESKQGGLEITTDLSGEGDVDQKLIELAKSRKASLITVDFNLNRAAQVSGVKVLNINELANALKTLLVPGEAVAIEVISEGKEASQGVGYLEDGTMVVVENGHSLLGKKIEVEVTRALQTEAGRMIFAREKASK